MVGIDNWIDKTIKKGSLQNPFISYTWLHFRNERGLTKSYSANMVILKPITKMKINLRHQYLSRSRYNRYLYPTHNHKKKAKRLYNANIRLAQAFHPLLTQFEVILRNSLNNILAAHFIDPDWIINQKNGFMPITETSWRKVKDKVYDRKFQFIYEK